MLKIQIRNFRNLLLVFLKFRKQNFENVGNKTLKVLEKKYFGLLTNNNLANILRVATINFIYNQEQEKEITIRYNLIYFLNFQFEIF